MVVLSRPWEPGRGKLKLSKGELGYFPATLRRVGILANLKHQPSFQPAFFDRRIRSRERSRHAVGMTLASSVLQWITTPLRVIRTCWNVKPCRMLRDLTLVDLTDDNHVIRQAIDPSDHSPNVFVTEHSRRKGAGFACPDLPFVVLRKQRDDIGSREKRQFRWYSHYLDANHLSTLPPWSHVESIASCAVPF